MKLLRNSNSKLKKTSKKNNVNIFVFDLPSGENKNGEIICPGADTCKLICYASKGFYIMPSVKKAYETNYYYSKQDNFIELIQKEIDSKKKKITHIRIHSSGDFYNKSYLLKWLQIAKNNPRIIFYCYTKSINLFKNTKYNNLNKISTICNIKEILNNINNFKYCFSYGSKYDHLINDNTDYHSKIFKTENKLNRLGYINASYDDLLAINPNNNKIGLIYH